MEGKRSMTDDELLAEADRYPKSADGAELIRRLAAALRDADVIRMTTTNWVEEEGKGGFGLRVSPVSRRS